MMQMNQVADAVAADPELKARLQADPEGTLRSVAVGLPLQTDVWIYRAVVGSLGGVVLCSVVGALVLSFCGKVTPEVVTALGSAAVGAMAGLLAPTSGR